MAYHLKEIEKGILGQFSKIREEFEELSDAVDQNAPVLELCELSDLIGAIEAYALKWNVSLTDLIQMMEMNKSAFKEGKR